MSRHHKPLLNVIKSNLNSDNLIGAEIGVWEGNLSEFLFNNLPNLTLIMLDPWELHEGNNPTMKNVKEEYVQARLLAEQRTNKWLNKRILIQDYSPTGISKIDKEIIKNGLDFVFIDGNHTYDSVMKDILGWHLLVKKGGILSGHDYNGVGDRRKGWGVKKAVDEWASKNGLEVLTPGGLVWYTKIT